MFHMPWARSFCPLPFPSAGDRWFRACGASFYTAKLRFYFQTRKRFLRKVIEKSWGLQYQDKDLCESVKSVGIILCPTDFTDSHR